MCDSAPETPFPQLLSVPEEELHISDMTDERAIAEPRHRQLKDVNLARSLGSPLQRSPLAMSCDLTGKAKRMELRTLLPPELQCQMREMCLDQLVHQ
jgi:hypothetical protein